MSGTSNTAQVFHIQLLRGSKVIRTYKIASETVTIGSDQSCTLKMAGDRSLMPMHATLYQEDGEITVIPESGATVLLNGEAVDFGVILAGDVVKIGRMTFMAQLIPVGDSIVPESGRQSRAPTARVKHSAPPPRYATKKNTLPAPAPVSNVTSVAEKSMPPKPASFKPAPPAPGSIPPRAPSLSSGTYSQVSKRTTRAPGRTSVATAATAAPPVPSGTPRMRKPSGAPGKMHSSTFPPKPSQVEAVEDQPELASVPPLMEEEMMFSMGSDRISDAPTVIAQKPSIALLYEMGIETREMTADDTGLSADDYFYDDGDDPEDDEFFFMEPFDLTDALSGERARQAITDARVALETYCAADVVRTLHHRVAEAEYVQPGKRYRAAFDDIRIKSKGTSVEITADARLWNTVEKGGSAVRPDALPQKKGRCSVALTSGDHAVLTGVGGTYRIDVYRPPMAPLKDALGFNKSALSILAGAIVLHVAFGLMAYVLFPSKQKEIEAQEDEVFAEVEMEKPEFKKEEEPIEKPKPKKVAKDATAMAERAPSVSNKTVRRIRERATTAKPSSSVSSLLSVLSKGSGKAGKTNNIKDLVSNIDAVGGSKGSAAYNIAGAIASLPGGDVNVARQGGGGAVSTLSGEQVAGKGSKIAELARSKPSGKIRGKVTKMSSSARVKGSLSKEDVSRVVNSNIHAVQACYEKALLRSPGMSGRIVFDWTVKQDGRVSGVRVRSSTLGNSSVSSCISDKIKKWKFPRPKGGEVVITYPFLFRSVSS